MIQNGVENVFLLIVQAVTEVLNKSHLSLQMGNCPISVAEHSGLNQPNGPYYHKNNKLFQIMIV